MPAGSASDIQRLFIAALLAAGPATACKQTHVVLESSADGGADDTGGPGGADGTTGPDGPGGAGGADAAGTGGTIVSASYYHACAIAGGALYCWGRNDDGRLGVGDTDPHNTPTRVGDGTDWADIQVAEVSALGRKQDGTIWAFGN
ncbi:MAG TPA: RCC1 domain-containing protein, partial [Polyangia bacterium]